MNSFFNFLLRASNYSFIYLLTIASIIVTTQSSFAAPVHAFFADEKNTTSSSSSGNRILEIDIKNMTLVNTLAVDGRLGHHVDNGYNSKVYGVPKESGFVNAIEIKKDQNGATSMIVSKKINLIHKPRSGDAYNKKFNVILMVASNRPMGSFINVVTDKVVGTIGENINCRLTDGSMLLSHSDANTIQAATKYQCENSDHGGEQISGHPYWLTADYAAVIDRANRQISVYKVWQDGDQLKSELVNHLPTRTSIHQIIPRDRTNLPINQQADFYAIEEGNRGDLVNYGNGIPHALIKMRLTTNGLQFVRRMNLQRLGKTSTVKAKRILDTCITNYRNTNNYRNGRTREQAYNDLFESEGITRNPDQDPNNDFPVDCFYPGIPGGHNADFAPNNKHVYVPMAGGAMSIIDVNRWKIVNNIDIGAKSGPGHTCFSEKHDIAFTTNHATGFTRMIRNINSNRPTINHIISFPFARERISNTFQSHTCYIDENEDFYYNFWTDGGFFYKIDIKQAINSTGNNSVKIADSLYTGGIPIQGSYINLNQIKDHNPNIPFKLANDTANSDGSAITIDVLANDSGNNLVLRELDTAAHGSLKIVNGKAMYTPNKGFSGTDEFWYGVSSYPSYDSWEWALVTVTVKSSIQTIPLKTQADFAKTAINTPVTIDILANDFGNGLYIGWVEADYGTAIVSNNKLIYTPLAGFNGVDDFWYEVLDASGESTWENIRITIGSQTKELVAKDDIATVNKGGSVSVNVLANDSGNSLYLSEVDSAWTGTVTKSANNLVYKAPTDFIGTVVAWYGVRDSFGNEKWAKVTITITN